MVARGTVDRADWAITNLVIDAPRYGAPVAGASGKVEHIMHMSCV